MIAAAIPLEFEQFVKDELATGKYQSAEEVVSDALRLLRQQKLESLRRDLDLGLSELARGEGIQIEDEKGLDAFFDGVRQRGLDRLAAERRPQ
jgi:antitoxin ParD1/3/4